MIKIKVEHLSYTYPYSPKPALSDINFEVNEREFILITGPSGSGKTTLALSLAGVIPHILKGGTMKGQVLIDGVDSRLMKLSEIARKIGMIFQDPECQFFGLTVEEEVAFGLENLCFPRDIMEKKVNELLAFSGLLKFRKKEPSSLSGGQKQRLAIISVLAMEPSVIILDEPTSNLDPYGAALVSNTLQELQQTGKTIILIERKAAHVIPLATRIIALEEGKIVVDTEPRKFYANEALLKKLQVYTPQVIRVAHKLKELGFNFNEFPLTVEELCELLKTYKSGGHATNN
jgi:energy-coupling factor transport system ATP-binding protein